MCECVSSLNYVNSPISKPRQIKFMENDNICNSLDVSLYKMTIDPWDSISNNSLERINANNRGNNKGKNRDNRNSTSSAFRPPNGKYWWSLRVPNIIKKKYYIAAGGILICDKQLTRNGENKEGIWVLAEKAKKGIEYTDIGGKYSPDDGDIYATISREFREELYNTAEIPYRQIKYLCTNNMTYEGISGSIVSSEVRKKIENSGTFKGVCVVRRGLYLSLIVNRSFLPSITLDPIEVEKARKRIVNSNEFSNEEFYRTISLKFLPYDEIKENYNLLSYRLRTVLLGGPLKFKINLDN